MLIGDLEPHEIRAVIEGVFGPMEPMRLSSVEKIIWAFRGVSPIRVAETILRHGKSIRCQTFRKEIVCRNTKNDIGAALTDLRRRLKELNSRHTSAKVKPIFFGIGIDYNNDTAELYKIGYRLGFELESIDSVEKLEANLRAIKDAYENV